MKGMTYGIMAMALLLLALLWLLFSGRGGSRVVDEMDAAIVAGDEAALIKGSFSTDGNRALSVNA